MLRAGRVSPLLKRKSLMTKSPSFWFGQWVVEGACAKAGGAAVSSRAAAKARRVIDILQNGGGSGRPENQSRPSKVGCFDIAEKASAGQSAMLMHLLPGELWTTCGGSVDTRIQCALRPRKSRLRVPFLELTRITCLSGPSPVVPRIWDITLARPPEASIQGRPRPRRHR